MYFSHHKSLKIFTNTQIKNTQKILVGLNFVPIKNFVALPSSFLYCFINCLADNCYFFPLNFLLLTKKEQYISNSMENRSEENSQPEQKRSKATKEQFGRSNNYCGGSTVHTQA